MAWWCTYLERHATARSVTHVAGTTTKFMGNGGQQRDPWGVPPPLRGLSELLADALRRLYATMGTGKAPKVTDLAGLIDATWTAIGNPRFKAVLEAWLAMANDPTLRAEIGPVVAELASLVNPDGKAPSILVDDTHRDYYLMAREALLGLALGRATNGGQALGHENAVLTRLRAGATALDPTPTT